MLVIAVVSPIHNPQIFERLEREIETKKQTSTLLKI